MDRSIADVAHGTGVAALKASAATGPIVLVVMAIGQLLSGETLAVRMGSTELASAAGMAVWFSVGAAMVSMIPNCLGAIFMGWASTRNIGLRHPAAWGMAGAVFTGAPVLAMKQPSDFAIAGWAAVGALSALVCRVGVSWRADQPTA